VPCLNAATLSANTNKVANIFDGLGMGLAVVSVAGWGGPIAGPRPRAD